MMTDKQIPEITDEQLPGLILAVEGLAFEIGLSKANDFRLMQRVIAGLRELQQSRRILAGLPQEAIDGGWTAEGISAYAKRIDDEIQQLKKTAVPFEKHRQEVAYLKEQIYQLVRSCKGLESDGEVSHFPYSVMIAISTAQQYRNAQAPALRDVVAERQRQITEEDWTPEGDDDHVEGQMAQAAACYALLATQQGFSTPANWPWSPDWWKQSGQRRDLVKAGALILAEIERLDRAEAVKNDQ